ncbi:MAG: response regulator, partial [Chloroflexi bacterium]|nr:response regulator [Chloroflexota bacterium]
MRESLRVLIVEDNEDDAVLLVHALQRAGYDVISERVETKEAMQHALTNDSWNIILSDHALAQFSAFAALSLLKESDLDIPFIIVSGTIGEETAAAAMRAGAHNYVLKGNWARLVPAVQREIQEAVTRRARREAEEEVRRHAARAEVLVHTAARLNAQLDLQGVLDAICEETVRALRIPAASVVLYDDASQSYRHAAGIGLPTGFEILLPLLPQPNFPRTNNHQDTSQAGLLILPDLHRSSDLSDSYLYEKLNLQSLASICLEHNAELIGYLNIFSFGEPRDFTLDEIELLKGIAHQAAQAIANARLFEEAKRRLHPISASNDNNLAISGSLDLRTTLNVLLTKGSSRNKFPFWRMGSHGVRTGANDVVPIGTDGMAFQIERLHLSVRDAQA